MGVDHKTYNWGARVIAALSGVLIGFCTLPVVGVVFIVKNGFPRIGILEMLSLVFHVLEISVILGLGTGVIAMKVCDWVYPEPRAPRTFGPDIVATRDPAYFKNGR
jgi:hypothetical protein